MVHSLAYIMPYSFSNLAYVKMVSLPAPGVSARASARTTRLSLTTARDARGPAQAAAATA